MTQRNEAQRTKTYLAALVDDVDGIKTSIATVAAPVTYVSATDFNGAQVAAGGVLDLPRSITITLAANAGSYVATAIVITGKRGGITVTESLTPPDADGGVTLRGTQAFDIVDSVAFPAQVNTSGAFQIGVQDICAPLGERFIGVELAAADDLNVQYGEGAGAPTDKIPVAAAMVGVVKKLRPTRILTSSALSGPTAVGLTVYLP